jgi:hypothetical protein
MKALVQRAAKKTFVLILFPNHALAHNLSYTIMLIVEPLYKWHQGQRCGWDTNHTRYYLLKLPQTPLSKVIGTQHVGKTFSSPSLRWAEKVTYFINIILIYNRQLGWTLGTTAAPSTWNLLPSRLQRDTVACRNLPRVENPKLFRNPFNSYSVWW